MATRTTRLKAVKAAERTMPDLRQSVKDAVAAMNWLTASDQAMVDLAHALADQIESSVSLAEEYDAVIRDVASSGDDGLLKRVRALEARADVQKVVGWLGVQLQGVLRDIGGAPVARKAMQGDAPVGGALAAIKAQAGAAKGRQ